MQRYHARTDRLLKIELLRARAELERQTVRHAAKEISGRITPSLLFSGLMSGFSTRSTFGWLAKLPVLTLRYPFLISAATALISGTGRQRWIKAGLGALAVWQVIRAQRSASSVDTRAER